MKEIQLNKSKKSGKNYKKYVAIISDRDFSLVNKFNWSVVKDDHRRYARAKFPIKNGKRKQILMHRLILGITNDKIKVDHI